MKNVYNTDTNQDSALIAPLYKEKWVSISLKYDDFWKFTYQFLIPFKLKAEQLNIMTSLYYKVEYPYDHIIQLNFIVSQFTLDRHFKPMLFESLNDYFDTQKFLLDQPAEKVFAAKQGYEGYDFDQFNLLGIEEYFIDPMAYIIGLEGAKKLQDLSVCSSTIILNVFQNAEEGSWTVEDSIEKSLSLHFAVLHVFIGDWEETYHFLAWITCSMFDNIKKLNGVVDMLEWKYNALQGMQTNFEESKDAILGYAKYVLETLESQDKFEEEWLNDWIQNCYDCKNKLNLLQREGGLLRNDNALNDDKTVFHDIDNVTYRNWQIVYSILRTINSQSGINLNYYLELDLFYSMKQSLMILSETRQPKPA